jgi:hypothetical protein
LLLWKRAVGKKVTLFTIAKPIDGQILFPHRPSINIRMEGKKKGIGHYFQEKILANAQLPAYAGVFF